MTVYLSTYQNGFTPESARRLALALLDSAQAVEDDLRDARPGTDNAQEGT